MTKPVTPYPAQPQAPTKTSDFKFFEASRCPYPTAPQIASLRVTRAYIAQAAVVVDIEVVYLKPIHEIKLTLHAV